ncbi:hypothetical protein NMY22_g6032 [Coprinellus aureogranulatus]|nr:hypothetical protein NMY22_g10732 [Coprinellus aureogranulatus]KAJ3536467.1 hypothetical protein NMY22_g6032 [Coprinellus aureogranulatus]
MECTKPLSEAPPKEFNRSSKLLIVEFDGRIGVTIKPSGVVVNDSYMCGVVHDLFAEPSFELLNSWERLVFFAFDFPKFEGTRVAIDECAWSEVLPMISHVVADTVC